MVCDCHFDGFFQFSPTDRAQTSATTVLSVERLDQPRIVPVLNIVVGAAMDFDLDRVSVIVDKGKPIGRLSYFASRARNVAANMRTLPLMQSGRAGEYSEPQPLQWSMMSLECSPVAGTFVARYYFRSALQGQRLFCANWHGAARESAYDFHPSSVFPVTSTFKLFAIWWCCGDRLAPSPLSRPT
jgi:hypothetical protein